MVASAIINDDIVQDAAKKEIVRRYLRAQCDYKKGQTSYDTVSRTQYLMSELDINSSYLKVVPLAKQTAKQSGYPAIALELPNGEFVTGKTKKVISASGAVILNALRTLADLGDDFDVIPDEILMPIMELRKKYLHTNCSVLTIDDVLMALAISSSTNKKAKKALDQLPKLKGMEAHCTYILRSAEEQTLKKLQINITCQPEFISNNLFQI